MKLRGLFKRKKATTIVLGVHGLGNKPSHGLLKSWWKMALIEGLKKIDGAPTNFDFRMVYWADIMYKYPLNPRVKNPDHDLHIEEPYIPEPIPSPAIRHTFWHLLKLSLERFKQIIFLSKSGLSNYRGPFNFVVKREFKDLAEYYQLDQTDEERIEQEPVKKKIRDRLRRFLYKHRKKKIIIIAHSMGSIVSFDVLSKLHKVYDIDVFVSMGSPLGLPLLRESIAEEHGFPFEEDEDLLPAPENINKWYNLSDLEDPFAVYHDLHNYYGPNSKGIGPTDVLVNNDYKDWVTNNAHKSFGYLRSPEMASILADFLNQKEDTFWEKGKKYFKVLSGPDQNPNL
ncbi:MAG: alpha/beta hydrolase [Reichenbachiella sp.]